MEYKGDFLSLLKANGYQFGINAPNSTNNSTQPKAYRNPPTPFGKGGNSVGEASEHIQPTEGTTVIAVSYSEGIVIAGDRRAISGTSVIYDRADKVINIDDYSVLAISGSPAIAYELARVLENSFKYYRRSQLQELSLEGKLRMLSKLLRDNLPMALQGFGAVIPIFAAYDKAFGVQGAKPLQAEDGGGKIFFYDVLGAQFECADFATTGSGSVWIRGALYYLNRWGEKRLVEMKIEESITIVLRLLDAASEYDTATGGYNRKSNIFPLVKTITQEGIHEMSADYLNEIYTQFVEKSNAYNQ